MPRFNTFSAGMNGASSGIGKALGALLGGGQSYQDAYDAELGSQAKLAQALAQVRQADAAARLHDAQIGEVNARARETGLQADVLQRRPGMADLAMAAAAGTDVPTLSAYREKLTTGQAPQVPMGPPAEDGSMGTGKAQFGVGTSSKLSQALSRLGPILNAAKDIKPDDYAKALDTYRSNDLGDQVIAGDLPAATVGRAQAAVGAKPLYHAGESGAVLDLFGGGLAVDNPLAQGNIGLIGAKTKEQEAAARHQLASAGAQSALGKKYGAETTKITEETSQLKNGPKGTYDPERGLIVDPRTGDARPVVMGGQPIGAKDKPLPEAAQKQVLGARNLQDAVGGYLQVLEGFNLTDMTKPDARAKMGNAYNNMMLQAKEAYNLGVLNGPDYDILQSVVKDPTKWSSAFVSKPALADQATRLRSIAANIEKTALEGHGKPYKPRANSGGATGDFGGPAAPQRTVTVNY